MRVGLNGVVRARREALRVIKKAESAPPSVAGRPTAFPGTAGLVDGKRGARSDLHPTPLRFGGRGGMEAGGTNRNGQGWRWERPSPSRAVEVGGKGGVTNLVSHPAASAGSPIPHRLAAWGDSSPLGESIITGVFTNLHKECIIGIPWLFFENLIIDWARRQVIVGCLYPTSPINLSN